MNKDVIVFFNTTSLIVHIIMLIYFGFYRPQSFERTSLLILLISMIFSSTIQLYNSS